MPISKTMTESGRTGVGSAYMINGMNSGEDPMFIDNQCFRSSMNTLNRGGVVRTRPGYQKIFDLPSNVTEAATISTADGVTTLNVSSLWSASWLFPGQPVVLTGSASGQPAIAYVSPSWVPAVAATVPLQYTLPYSDYTTAAWTQQLQGLSYFKPLFSEAYLVFAVGGRVYQSQYPFSTYAQLPNVQFDAFAKQVYFCQCVQGAHLNTDGSVSVQNPQRVVVMQDGGYTRSAYWDGNTSMHLDPSVPATFQSVIDTTGAVSDVQVTYGGTGYTNSPLPTITFQAPSAVAGTAYRTALGHVVVGAGQIQSVVIDDPGTGYTFAPAVSISGQKFGPPLGGPMAWSGDRLWVAQDNKVLASDISNPLGFSESIYASGGGYFMFTENVTALAEIPSFQDPNLAVFTRNTSSILQSSIRDRSTWQSTPDFQSTMFPGVGCVGQRSVIAKFGELWWVSESGLISFNAAEQSKITSYMVPQDTAMAVSKFNLSADLSGCAGIQYENFLLLSVPYGDKLNDHTWVYDQAVTSGVAQSIISGPYQGATAAWAGYWTGTRPVQWTAGPCNGVNRVFYVSVDYDGTNRLWEAFTPDRSDNGQPITCFLETKTHADFGQITGGLLDLKKFIFAEVHLTDLMGPVKLSVNWAGTRGVFKDLGDYNLTATEGSVVANVNLGTLETYRSQVRRLKTLDANNTITAPCSSALVEAPGELIDVRDIGFSLLFQWQGELGVRGYRVWCDPEEEAAHGEAPVYEYDPRILEGALCL